MFNVAVVKFCVKNGTLQTQQFVAWDPRPRIYRPPIPDFFALLFMLYSTAAYDSHKFEREIQIQSNDLN